MNWIPTCRDRGDNTSGRVRGQIKCWKRAAWFEPAARPFDSAQRKTVTTRRYPILPLPRGCGPQRARWPAAQSALPLIPGKKL